MDSGNSIPEIVRVFSLISFSLRKMWKVETNESIEALKQTYLPRWRSHFNCPVSHENGDVWCRRAEN
jgi:hypothetical protein